MRAGKRRVVVALSAASAAAEAAESETNNAVSLKRHG